MKDDLQLQQWQVAPRIPAGFQREVWARIAVRQAAPKGFWVEMLEWLAMPRYAAAAFAMVLCGSVLLGLSQANAINQQARQSVQARYALSLNPIAHALARR